MPEGPASGRVEAKRRALTRPSTAPGSSTRWWLDRFGRKTKTYTPREHGHAREPIVARSSATSFDDSGHARGHAGGAFLPHELGTQTSTWDTDQQWRERPRGGTLGSGARQNTGVVHAIVGSPMSIQASLDESA
jgi:hypothetical protein